MEPRPDQSADNLPIIPLAVFFGSVLVLLAVLLAAQPPRTTAPRVAAEPTLEPAAAEATLEATPEATAQAVAVAAGPGEWNLDPAAVRAGEGVFHTVCMACHGFNGEGIVGLGKSLVGTEFVNSLSDEELVQFIAVGREVRDPLNTTGVAMPARGGNPGLSDQDLAHTVAFIRSLNVAAGFGPGGTGADAASANVEPTAAPAVAAAPTTAPLVVEGGIAPEIGVGELNLALTDGESAYRWTCAPCHGSDGSPVAPFATLPLSESPLVQAQDTDGLFEFLASPQPPVNPLEGFPHPARGGYPVLTDEQINAVIEYVYTLTGE